MRWPCVRFTVRRLMIVIALIGLAMFAVRGMYIGNTVYSAGYDESRFRQVGVGMTSEEVEALMGPPLRRAPWGWPPDQDVVRWMYTDSRPGTSDYYWRRDVLMKSDKFIYVINEYEWPD